MNLQELTDAIVAGDMNKAVAMSQQAIEGSFEPQAIISDYLIKGMDIIGARFGEGKAFVPNLLMSARAMKGCLDYLKPLMKGDTSISYGKVVIGTVKGDLHDIGKNLVARCAAIDRRRAVVRLAVIHTVGDLLVDITRRAEPRGQR